MLQLKNKLTTITIVVVLAFLCTSSQAQQNTISIKQSAFYDAIVLYYASHHCAAFPLPMQGQSMGAIPSPSKIGQTINTFDAPTPTTTRVGTNNSGPGLGIKQVDIDTNKNLQPTSTNFYTIIESSSGKILEDNIAEQDLVSELNKDTLTEDDYNALISEILNRNAGITSDSSLMDINTVQNLYSNNKYFRPFSYKDPFKKLVDSNYNIYNLNSKNAGKNGGNLGNGSSPIINGLTDYLIGQVNAEVNEAFFIQLKEILSKDSALVVLFPQTLASLNKISITQYAQAISTIRSAYQQDINQLLQHVSSLATIQKYHNVLINHPELTLVFAACDMISMVKQGLHPAEIFNRLGNASYINGLQSRNNYAAAFATGALLSNSLRDVRLGIDNPQNNDWVPSGELQSFLYSEDVFKCYMSLLTQQATAQKITFTDGNDSISMSGLLNQNKEGIKAQYLVYNFLNNYSKLTATIKKFTDEQNTLSPTQLSGYSSLYIDIVVQFCSFENNVFDIFPSNVVIKPRRIINQIKVEYVPLLQQVNDVIAALEAKDYNLVIYKSEPLLAKILDSSVCVTYLKYGTFISNIAMAQNSADVQAAIKAIALPTGSSRIKKDAVFSWGLNAYAGVYNGWNFNHKTNSLPSSELGITVPIGVAVNFGLDHGYWGSLSIYGGIIDVGAIFTYKLNSDSSVSSDIELSQILSPSLGVIWGLPLTKKGYNIPLSFGANFQWGPELSKIDTKGNSVLRALAPRFNLFMAIDIPVINFHVSKR
jgi:hypothetical protein